jgi:protein-disulfide isomerase
MREFPIPNLHPRAEAASEAALCAGEQDNYWGMHDALFNDQRATSDEDFQRFAGELGLDVEAFAGCLAEDRYLDQIRSDQVEGQKLGISGTPSFVLGLTDPDDPQTVHLTRFIRGAQPLPTFTAAIDGLLNAAEAEEDAD